jgi:hypothetical protein
MKFLSVSIDSEELEMGQGLPPVELLDDGSKVFTELERFRRKSHSR